MPDESRTSKSSKADVEAQLHRTSTAIHDRLDALQEEASTTGASIRTWLRAHPWASVGGAAAAGLLLGSLLGGSRRRLRRTHRELVDTYVQALREEVEAAVAEGEDVGPAVQEALRNRAPLVVYAKGGGSSSGWIRQALEMVVDTAVAFIVRDAVSGWMDRNNPLGDDEAVASEAAASEVARPTEAEGPSFS